MAPPPSANLPLSDRILALAQTLQCMLSIHLSIHPSTRMTQPGTVANLSAPDAVAWFSGYVRSQPTLTQTPADT